MNVGLLLGAGFAFVAPLAALIIWKSMTGAKLKTFVVGAICFVLFAMGFEQLLHTVCIATANPISAFITGNPIAYMLYGGLAAGIFEETGRYFGFKVLLKDEKKVTDAVAYGIGHGGIEMILTLGMTYVIYLVISMTGASLGAAEADSVIQAAIASVTPGMAAMAIVERISALMLHIGLSIAVFAAVHKKAFWMYLIAIVMHACADFPAALYQLGMASIPVVETITFVFSCIVLAFGIILYKKMKTAEQEN